MCNSRYARRITAYFKRHSTRLMSLIVLATFQLGCSVSEQRASDEGSVDVDRLRALPYVTSTAVKKNQKSGVTYYDRKRSFVGYTLYSIQKLSFAELFDPEGSAIRRWSYQPSYTWERCRLLPNGDVLAVGTSLQVKHKASPDGQNEDPRYLLRLDWNGRLLWKRKLSVHHDVVPTPDGELLALGLEHRLIPSFDTRIKVLDNHLLLLRADGTLIESHSIFDAGPRERFPLQFVRPRWKDRVVWYDLFHSNSMHWIQQGKHGRRHPIYEKGNVLVCFRNQDRVAVINWERNEIIWSWGREQLSGPHDAQVLDNGNILLLDNGLSRKYSRGLELDPTSEKIVWQYVADPPTEFFTASKGSIQRLPNGNTLLAESDKGRAIEVTPEGEVVWEFVCPVLLSPKSRAAIVRVRRYSESFIQPLLSRMDDAG